MGLDWWVNKSHGSDVTSVVCSLLEVVRLWHQNEWSVNEQTEVFIKSLSLYWLHLIDVNDLPLLVETVMLLVWENILCFKILSFNDIKNKSFNIDDVSTNELEVSLPLVFTEACECCGSVVI